MEATLTQILGRLLTQIPLLIVWIVGLIIALVQWKNYPRVALLVLIALLGFFLTTIMSSAAYALIPMFFLRDGDYSASHIGMAYTIYGVIHAILDTVFWVLLLLATFGWRKQTAAITQDKEKADE